MSLYNCPECGIIKVYSESDIHEPSIIICPKCTTDSPYGGPEVPYNEAIKIETDKEDNKT